MADEVKVERERVPPSEEGLAEEKSETVEPEVREQVKDGDEMVEEPDEPSESDAPKESYEPPLEPKEVKTAEFQQLAKGEKLGEKQNIQMVLDVTLPISIELGRTAMSIGEILELGPGSVVELEKLAGEPVDVLVNEKVVARGEVVVVDENFGVRITQLVSKSDLIKNL
ncbi:MAG: flagellar motor switch protein FliN [candidate division Zixibacteria bacterium]|nr:flagellar motor switch protein FliN [candidate division Zixibacteria bacterium]